MLTILNMLLAFTALGGGLLIARGFIPHLDVWGKTPDGYMTRGLAICALSTFPRAWVWDVMWAFPSIQETIRDIGAAPINAVANIILLIGIWHILYARLLTIPKYHRHRYNIITAPGYPGCVLKSPHKRMLKK